MLPRYRMSEVMTPEPMTIHPEEWAHRAAQVMRKSGVRHLPVTVDGELVGVLTDREIRTMSEYPYPDKLRVAELMQELPYCVEEGDPVADAIRAMAQFKFEVVAVTRDRRTLQGIFTRHDALQLIQDARSTDRPPLRLAA